MSESTYTKIDLYNLPHDILVPNRYKFRYEIQTKKTLPLKETRNDTLVLMMYHKRGMLELKFREAE